MALFLFGGAMSHQETGRRRSGPPADILGGGSENWSNVASNTGQYAVTSLFSTLVERYSMSIFMVTIRGRELALNRGRWQSA